MNILTMRWWQCIQGYLAHKKPPTPLGPPKGPTHSPTVGSQGGRFLMGEVPLYCDNERVEAGVRIHSKNTRMSGRHGVLYVAQCVACAALTLAAWQQITNLADDEAAGSGTWRQR